MSVDSENLTSNDFYVKETYKQGLSGKTVSWPLGRLGEG